LISGTKVAAMEDAKKKIDDYLKKQILVYKIQVPDATKDLKKKLTRRNVGGLLAQAFKEISDECRPDVQIDLQETCIILVGLAEKVKEVFKDVKDLVNKASLVPIEFEIDEAKLRIFNKSVLSKISAESECDVVRDWNKNQLTILGARDNVERAKRLIEETLEQQGAVTEVDTSEAQSLQIKALKEKLAAIQKELNVVVTLQREEYKCVIMGSATNISKAKARIEDILAEEQAAIVKQEREIEQEQVGGIIGRKGATLRHIKEESGADVRVKNDRVIVIKGSEEAVKAADILITAILEGNNDSKGKGKGKGKREGKSEDAENQGEGKGKGRGDRHTENQGEGKGKGKGKGDRQNKSEGKGKGKSNDNATKGDKKKWVPKYSESEDTFAESFPTLPGELDKNDASAGDDA